MRRETGVTKAWKGLLSIGVLLLTSQIARAGDTLVYNQSTGEFFEKGGTGGVVLAPIAMGYSGAGKHKNNHDSQCIDELGPIPVGVYTMAPMADVIHSDGHKLASAIRLTPDPKNQMCGRTAFLIHGESKTFPKWASGGCIILDLDSRKKLSKFKTLEVVVGKAS